MPSISSTVALVSVARFTRFEGCLRSLRPAPLLSQPIPRGLT